MFAGTGRGEAQNGMFLKHNATFLSLLTSNTLCFSTDGVSLVHISVCMHTQTKRPHEEKFNFGVIHRLF
jgi:hypothetical protein